MLFVVLILTSSTFICCSHKFKVKYEDETYLSDSDEEEMEQIDEIIVENEERSTSPRAHLSDVIYDNQYRRFLTLSTENLVVARENTINLEDDRTLSARIKIFSSLIWDNIRSVFIASDAQLVNVCGTDVYYFNWFQKYLITFSIVCGILSMIVVC